MGIHEGVIPPSSLKNCLFLDRDGVINDAVVRDGRPYPPSRVEDLKYIDGIHDLCRTVRSCGWLVVVVTNQPDVGRGQVSKESVEAIHEQIYRDLEPDGIEVCYDSGHDGFCAFRKPEPGMLLRAAVKHGIHLPGSFMVGDRWRDVDCGHAAGCATIFVDYAYNEPLRIRPDFTVFSVRDVLAVLKPFLASKQPSKNPL